MIIGTGPGTIGRPPLAWLLYQTKCIVSIAVMGLVLCLACLPVLAQDEDEKVAPPTPGAQASAGRMTIAVLSLITGGAVYYGMQRQRVMNADKHPPEWDKQMGRKAILFAVMSAILVWGVSTALSRPVPKPSHADVGAPRTVAHGACLWHGAIRT